MTHFANRSFWIDQFGEYQANAPLKNDIKVDVAVVGGGLCGLSTAYNLCQEDAALNVALLESEVVGFGASGRYAGWLMTKMGADPYMIRSIFGLEKAKAAQHYGEEALEYSRRMIEENNIDCDFRMTGLMKVAFDKKLVPKLEKFQKHCDELGMKGNTWLNQTQLQNQFDSPMAHAAIHEPDMGRVNPCKLVRGWKTLAEQAGADIYENTPAISIDRVEGGVSIKTPRGTVFANKVVLATNAYSHLLGGEVGQLVKRDQLPSFPIMHVTEKLSSEQWQRVVSKQYECPIESTLNLYHGYTPTADGRLVLFYFKGMQSNRLDLMRDNTYNMKNRADVLNHFEVLFPALKGVRVKQTWSGPISFTMDLVPHIGFMGDERVLISSGCAGHGAATAQQHGRTLSDLILNKDTQRSEFWMVKRKPLKWLPLSLGAMGFKAVSGLMAMEDKSALKKTLLQGL